jgi:hypothetical protein
MVGGDGERECVCSLTSSSQDGGSWYVLAADRQGSPQPSVIARVGARFRSTWITQQHNTIDTMDTWARDARPVSGSMTTRPR